MNKAFPMKNSGVSCINRARSFILQTLLSGKSVIREEVIFVTYQQVQRLSYNHRLGQEGKTNYYDVLQLTPKATQSQVKDAYYKMSKSYHPDQFKAIDGTDPSIKFREITEAYEVLGNFHKRKLYDRGLFNISAAATPAEAEEYSAKFYESRRKRGQAPVSTGRTPIYNFDEWSKLHYDNTRSRKDRAKDRYETFLRNQAAIKDQKKTETVITVVGFFGLFLIFNFLSHDNDSVKPKQK